ESRDVLGSLRYVRDRRDTRDMTIGLFSRCLGCSSTFCAMTNDPRTFDGVRCLVGPQPVTMKIIMTRRLALSGIPADRIPDLEQRLVLRTSIGFGLRAPQEWAKHVCVPTFLWYDSPEYAPARDIAKSALRRRLLFAEGVDPK